MELAAREKQAFITSELANLKRDDGDPVMGNVKGSLVIFEFSDYNCGYCKRMFLTIQQLLTNNDDVRLVIKEFPILSQSSNRRTGRSSRSKTGQIPSIPQGNDDVSWSSQ